MDLGVVVQLRLDDGDGPRRGVKALEGRLGELAGPAEGGIKVDDEIVRGRDLVVVGVTDDAQSIWSSSGSAGAADEPPILVQIVACVSRKREGLWPSYSPIELNTSYSRLFSRGAQPAQSW